VPGLDYGLGIRTRRLRPSEKTAPGVVPGFSPQGHPSWAGSPEGAGSARPERKPTLHPGISPSGDGPFAQSFSGIENPGHTRGHAPRAHGVRPSEKIVSRVISGLSRVGNRRCARPPLRGAGSARPQRNLLPRRGTCPWTKASPLPLGEREIHRHSPGHAIRRQGEGHSRRSPSAPPLAIRGKVPCG